jgi:hypothetical protein
MLTVLASVGTWSLAVSAASSRAAIRDAIQSLEADHDRALAAAYTLEVGGQDAAEALRDAWPSMSLLAQKRAIDPLVRLAARYAPAVDALVEAARSEDQALQRLGLAALARAERQGWEALVRLLSDPRVGDRAARLLARSEPSFAIAPLLVALSAEGGPDRAELRNALAVATERAEGSAQKLALWLRSDPPLPALASAAFGLSAIETQPAIVARLIERALGQLSDSSDFTARWRLLRSAGRAGPSQPIDRWLQAELREAPEWMLREAAVESLAMRGNRDRARPCLEDPYPRVRSRAATILEGDAATLVERAKLARRDAWPMVRAAAVKSLRREARALPVLVAAVDDSMSVVRAAAIEALRDFPHPEGWESVHRRLEDSSEWPTVTLAAIGYAVAHCRFDAVNSLLGVVRRAAPSNARTEDLNNAARAIEALRALQTPEAESAVQMLRDTEGIPPTLKMALDRPLSGHGRCATPSH